MPTTYDTFTGDGVTKSYSISFPYILPEHVKVRVDGRKLYDYEYTVSGSQVTLDSPPASGASVKVYRETPADARLVNYTPGSLLSEKDLNLSDEQNFYLLQELKDAYTDSFGFVSSLITEGQASGDIDLQATVDSMVQEVLSSPLLATLQSRIDAIDANALSILENINLTNDLQNRVITVEVDNLNIKNDIVQLQGDITSQASEITSLQVSYNDLNASLQNEISTRTTDVAALSQQISTLQAATNKIYVQASAPPDDGSLNVGDIWYDSDDGNHPYRWEGSQWVDVQDQQITALLSQVTSLEQATIDLSNATSLANRVNQLEAKVNENEALIYQKAEVEANRMRVLAETQELMHARWNENQALIYQEQSARASADNVLASDISILQARMDTAEVDIINEQIARADGDNALTSQISTLQSTVDGHTASLQVNATAIASAESDIQGLQGQMTDVLAQYTVKLDVNGYVTGFGLMNDGATSDFIVLADRFSVVTPGQTPKVPFIVGNVNGSPTVAIDGTLLVDGTVRAQAIAANAITADKINVNTIDEISPGLGTITSGTFKTASSGMRTEMSSVGSYPLWFGTGTKNAANAKFYLDTSGNVYVQGTLAAGRIEGGTVSTLDSTRIDCGGGRYAQYVCSSVSSYHQPSGTTSVTLDLGEFVAPTYGSGYHPRRVVDRVMDWFLEGRVDGDYGYETLVFEVSYDGGSTWEYVKSIRSNCNYRGGMTLYVRYTSKDNGWNTIKFRLRTVEAHTQIAAARVFVYNFNPSSNAPGSSSNTNGGEGGGTLASDPYGTGGNGSYIP